VKRKKPY